MVIALVDALIVLLLAYPLALVIARSAKRRRDLLLPAGHPAVLEQLPRRLRLG